MIAVSNSESVAHSGMLHEAAIASDSSGFTTTPTGDTAAYGRIASTGSFGAGLSVSATCRDASMATG